MTELEADIAAYFERRPPEAPEGCGRDADLARHLAGELDLSQHLATCADCREAHATVVAAARVWSPPGADVSSLARWAAPVLALAAGLAVFMLARPSPEPDRLTPKGTFALDVAVRRGTQQFRAPSGARLQTGDQLGLFYTSNRAGYLTVLYADDHAAPVRVYPARAPQAARVVAGQNVPLSDGVVLADGNGCEWVIALFTDAPLGAEKAEQAARQMVTTRRGCALGTSSEKGDVQVVLVNR